MDYRFANSVKSVIRTAQSCKLFCLGGLRTNYRNLVTGRPAVGRRYSRKFVFMTEPGQNNRNFINFSAFKCHTGTLQKELNLNGLL